MAKILVEDPEENTRVPLLRGILIHSLQEAGLSFDAAFEIATDIRHELEGIEVIASDELRRRVVNLLQSREGSEVAERYKKLKESLTIQVEQRDGQLIPFSRFEYQQGLETIALTSAEAMEIVATVYKHLVDRRIEVITSRHLGRLTYRYLRQSSELGEDVAKRWLVWRDFVNDDRPLIILLGGTSGCGKSTIATMLANRLDIVRSQSTDMLREVMRTMMPEQLLPILHTSSFRAWTVLPGTGAEMAEVSDNLLISGFRGQADLLTVAIEAVIKRALRERVSLILEGVHVQPAFMEQLVDSDEAIIVPIMLGVLKRKQLHQRIRGRGVDAPQRRSERYLRHFDEIWRLQSYLLSGAEKSNIPVVVNSDKNTVFNDIMSIVIETLEKDFDRAAKDVF
jgi:2-phosphoglycerate kinase|tara:strand:+ start:126 stop:1313 length:1188 start_codon:yes stop_codon:yes gene_type:complete